MLNHCIKCFQLRSTSRLDADLATQIRKVLLQPRSQVVNSEVCKKWISTSSVLNRKVRLMIIDKSKVNLQMKKQVRYSEDYIQQKVEEYDLGVRRLAGMMGEDPDTFTEDDVKRAIRYLLPTDLFGLSSRPQMEHPSVVFPAKIMVQTDKDGRPSHYLFYTRHPELYDIMHQAYEHVEECRRYADKMWKMGKKNPKPLTLQRTRWLKKDEIEKKFLNREINDDLYTQFIAQLERLVEEPCSINCEDFIMKFRTELVTQGQVQNLPEIEVDSDGRQFVRSYGSKKTAKAEVKLIANGSGKITINGQPMQKFFIMIPDRETLITPFTFLGLNLRFDVEATVDGGFQGYWTMLHGSRFYYDGVRKASMAGAIRYGISDAIRSFISPAQIELMRRAGLLTADPRRRERKKPGQEGARRKFTWRKR